MAKTIEQVRFGQNVSLTQQKAQIKRIAKSNNPTTRSYLQLYYSSYRKNGGKQTLRQILGK
jgi:hypothetical protein